MCDESWEFALRLVELCGGNPQVVRESARTRSLSPELVAHACRKALAIAATEHCQPAPFRKWEATPPGRLDVQVFDQDQYWVDALRFPHVVSDLDDLADDYLRAVIGFLIEHDEYFHRGYRRYRTIECSQPNAWLESTILMRGLRAEMVKRGLLVGPNL